MIITIKGANFSTNNIGTLTTWIISKTLGAGATYEGPDFVDRGAALNATVTVAEGYEILGTPSVSMGGVVLSSGVTVSGNVVTIAIGEVTGNVAINVATKSEAGEPETPTNYTFTINPDPTSATVTLSATGYSTVSGTGSKSITVANGTEVSWSVSADGYTEQTGAWTANGSDESKSVTLVESGEPDAPTSYIITYKYVDASGTTIKADSTETVTAGTVKDFSISGAPAVSGYTISGVNPMNATVNSDIIVTYTYTANEAGDEDISAYIQEGKAIMKVGELADNASFFSVVNYPVKGATYYLIPYARNAFCLTSTGGASGGILNGGGKEAATIRAAGTAATMSICFKYDDISPSDVTITETVAPTA